MLSKKTYLRLSSAFRFSFLIRMYIGPKIKISRYFYFCTVRHLNSPFVPGMGHLQVCFQKILMPGWGGGGMGTARNDCILTENLM